MTRWMIGVATVLATVALAHADDDDWLRTGRFSWTLSEPFVGPAHRPEDPCHAIKEPSVVFHGGQWHLFCTIRSTQRSHQIEYLAFADWKDADKSSRHVLKVADGYSCAQVFYFEPQKKWYLIYQATDAMGKPAVRPVFSTNDDVSKPDGWTRPVPLFDQHPANVRIWRDFWVICDGEAAYLFFTSLDGQMWRSKTNLATLPKGWDRPRVCLKADIFGAGHIYAIKGTGRYLAVLDAQGERGRRYCKAYLADRLDGTWQPLADAADRPFAGWTNIAMTGDRSVWTDSICHGEILRAGYDQKMEIVAGRLRVLFHGVRDEQKAGKGYGQIPWRVGILDLQPAPAGN